MVTGVTILGGLLTVTDRVELFITVKTGVELQAH